MSSVNGFSNRTSEQSPLLMGDILYSSMEEGTISPATFPGTVPVTTAPMVSAMKTKMKDAPQPPGTAAGDPIKFMPRQEFLLIEQYLNDRVDGSCNTTIGKTVCDILSKAEPKDGVNSTIDVKTAADIGLVAKRTPDSKGETIASKIDRTKTKLGSATLDFTLARPTANLDTIMNRQGVIRTFTQNQELQGHLQSTLENMSQGEISLLSCWDGRGQLPGSASSLYYKMNPRINEIANNSALALDFSAAGVTIKKSINTAMQAISGAVLTVYAASEVSRAFAGTHTPDSLESYAEKYTGSTPVGVVGTLSLEAHNPVVNAVVAALAATYCITSIQSSYDWLKADTAMLPLMREILSSVATYYKGMKDIHAVLQDHPEITEQLQHFQKLDDFVRNTENIPELKTLLSTLESFTFNPDNKILFRPGEVLLAWELLHSGGGKKAKGTDQEKTATAGDKIRSAFEEALPAIGEIDSLLSLSQLMGEGENGAKYCFPTFITNSGKPKLHLKGVWNPMLGSDHAVPNDINLGENAASNGAIITGPNTGGKSCLAKAIALAAVMASLGICPAESAEMTVFNFIRTSMNIQDSVEKGESLFASQCKIIGEVVKGAQELPPGVFSLTVLDEMYTQTNSAQGSELVMKSANDLGALENNTTVLVTHFKNVPETIGDTQAYKNYRMEGNGAYRLIDGISQDGNAFAVAEQFGVTGASNLK